MRIDAFSIDERDRNLHAIAGRGKDPLRLVIRRVEIRYLGALEERLLARIELVVVDRARRDERLIRVAEDVRVEHFVGAHVRGVGRFGEGDAMRLAVAQIDHFELRESVFALGDDEMIREEIGVGEIDRLAMGDELRPIFLLRIVQRRGDDAVVDAGVIRANVEAVAAMIGVVL